MKKIISVLVCLTMSMSLLCACTSNGVDAKATDIAKKFYTEYLNAKEEDARAKIRNKYMTSVLAEEIDLRTKQMEADATTGVQDDTGMLSKMLVTEGEDDSWAKVTFDLKQEEGVEYRVYEANIHFRIEEDKKLMDTLNLIIYDYDKDGDRSQMEYNTKYANKPELTEEDKAEMERIRQYYDNLEEQGFIG